LNLFFFFSPLYNGIKLLNELSPHFSGHSPTDDVMDNKADDSNSMMSKNAHFSLRNSLGVIHQDEVGITVGCPCSKFIFSINY
jgi:hypothetical protein